MTTVHAAMSCPSSVLHFVAESSQYPTLVAHCLSDIQQGAGSMNAIPQYIHMPLQGSHPCSATQTILHQLNISSSPTTSTYVTGKHHKIKFTFITICCRILCLKIGEGIHVSKHTENSGIPLQVSTLHTYYTLKSLRIQQHSSGTQTYSALQLKFFIPLLYLQNTAVSLLNSVQ